MMELAAQIIAAALITLIFLSLICLIAWGIAGCYDYHGIKPFTRAIEKILYTLLAIDLVVAVLMIGSFIVVLWIDIFI